ncbi:phage baseplate assembly protein [Derxia gummosa]|uniref:Phage baseplate assembly protein n=1 Tax=Derxia gummosa DSM 723 TaxID=1121388 RepID=A0A8B6X319_9BURK|nr:contractile injection system protein, VgrG/Pvc8 family [Derxia gummosa]
MTDDTITLRIAGTDYGGWLSASVTAGIERMARDFTVQLTRGWPGADVSALGRAVRPGDACEIRIGADRVMTGWIDATPIEYDGERVSITIRGRSRTADLVDCSAINKPGQWRGSSVEAIAAALAGSYGVGVLAEISTTQPVADHSIEQGETVQESLDRLLSPRGLLATDNADGDLVLIDVGSTSTDDMLRLGDNILRGAADLDESRVYRTYIAKGQSAASDGADIADTYGASATATDPAVTRPRTLMLRQSGQADGTTVQQRATYERDHRRARAQATTYTVRGWRQSSGALWQPNRLVRVRDPLIGWDQDMLIVEVTWSLDTSGQLTRLLVGPRAGYITPVPVQRLKKARKVPYVE